MMHVEVTVFPQTGFAHQAVHLRGTHAEIHAAQRLRRRAVPARPPARRARPPGPSGSA